MDPWTTTVAVLGTIIIKVVTRKEGEGALGLLQGVLADSVTKYVGGRFDETFKTTIDTVIARLKQPEPGKPPVNHDVQRAMRKAHLLATVTVCDACLKAKRQRSSAWQQLVAPEDDTRWLNKVRRACTDELKQLAKAAFIPPSSEADRDVTLFLRATNLTVAERLARLKASVCNELLHELEQHGPPPTCFVELVTRDGSANAATMTTPDWFSLVNAFFLDEYKQNSVVRAAIDGPILTDLPVQIGELRSQLTQLSDIASGQIVALQTSLDHLHDQQSQGLLGIHNRLDEMFQQFELLPSLVVEQQQMIERMQAAKMVTSLHQLRAPLTHFVGRQRELTVLYAALRPTDPSANSSAAKLCAICGMGGLGKTELALQVANAVQNDYPDAQLFISLRGSNTGPSRTAADGLRDAIRTFDAVTVLPDDIEALAAMYRGYLGGRRALVLLDDAPDVDSVRPFLPPVGCALIVTSRSRLSLGGVMTTLDLSLLSRDESSALLRELIPEVTDQQTLDALLNYCADLPLAVRVVGATLADDEALTPARYLARLADESRRLKALKHEGLDVYAVLGVGDDLLYAADPNLALRWRLLGVCPAPFDAATVAAIWSEKDEDELEAGLSRLVRRSLLSYDRATKQYRIHDLLRDVARTRRSPEQDTAARLGHASYYLAIVMESERLYQLGHQHTLAGLALFDAAWLHIQSAAAWIASTPGPETDSLCVYTTASSSVLDIRLQPRELTAWCAAAVAAAQRCDDQVAQAHALCGLGNGHYLSGNANQASESYKQSLTLFRTISDLRGEAKALHGLAQVLQVIGEWAEAEELYRRALVLAQGAGDQKALAWYQNSLGSLLKNTQSSEEALNLLGQSKDGFEHLGDQLGLSHVLQNLSSTYVRRGNYDYALKYAEELLQIATKHGDRIRLSAALHYIGVVYWQRGNPSDALEYLEQAINVATAIEYQRGSVIPRGDMAGVYWTIGDYDQSFACLHRALADATAIDFRQQIGLLIGNAGELYRQRGDYTLALACYSKGLEIAADIGDWPTILPFVSNIAAVWVAQGRYDDAKKLYARSINWGRSQAIRYTLADNLHRLAHIYTCSQEYAAAQTLNDEALEITKQARLKSLELEILVLAIQLRVALKHIDATTAIHELERLLETRSAMEEQAALHYEICQLDKTSEHSCQAAAKYYQELYQQTSGISYRKRYYALTGIELREPAPFPPLPTDVLRTSRGLEQLLEQLEVE